MLNLRLATDSDARMVADLIQRSFRKQAEELEIDREKYPNYVAFDTEARVSRRIARGARVTLAHLREQAIGTVTCEVARGWPGVGEITRLAVLPSHRGNKYGSILMAHAENQLKIAGLATAELSIVSKFTRLQSYYEQLGYRATEKKRFDTLPFEVLFMDKALSRGGQHVEG